MRLNLKLVQIGQKAPPPPPHLLVRYSARVVAHDITLCSDISCIIEPHIIETWQKSPPPQDQRKFFDTRSIHFRQFKQHWWEHFLTPGLSISGNLEQLWFWWQKSLPPPPQDQGNFLTPDLSISGNFEQLWFWWQKSLPPPPSQDEGNFLRPDLSISGNFKQLWFWWQKSPPPPG